MSIRTMVIAAPVATALVPSASSAQGFIACGLPPQNDAGTGRDAPDDAMAALDERVGVRIARAGEESVLAYRGSVLPLVALPGRDAADHYVLRAPPELASPPPEETDFDPWRLVVGIATDPANPAEAALLASTDAGLVLLDEAALDADGATAVLDALITEPLERFVLRIRAAAVPLDAPDACGVEPPVGPPEPPVGFPPEGVPPEAQEPVGEAIGTLQGPFGWPATGQGPPYGNYVFGPVACFPLGEEDPCQSGVPGAPSALVLALVGLIATCAAGRRRVHG